MIDLRKECNEQYERRQCEEYKKDIKAAYDKGRIFLSVNIDGLLRPDLLFELMHEYNYSHHQTIRNLVIFKKRGVSV